MKKWWIILLATGLFMIYYFWPADQILPKLKTVESFSAETITGGVYSSDTNKIKIVTFFYTNCPDICPLTFIDLQRLQLQLKDRGQLEKTEIITITIDPEIDTIERLRKYSENFQIDSINWHVVRASLEDTEKIASEFQMTFKKVDDNFLTHRTTMYLVDDKQKIRATYSMANTITGVDVEQILSDIEQLLDQ